MKCSVVGRSLGYSVVTAFLFAAMMRAEAQLIANGSFETVESTSDDWPSTFGDWSGDLSVIVTGTQGNGITPIDGDRMLHFLASNTTGEAPGAVGCNVLQLIDMSTFSDEISAGNR